MVFSSARLLHQAVCGDFREAIRSISCPGILILYIKSRVHRTVVNAAFLSAAKLDQSQIEFLDFEGTYILEYYEN